MTQLSNERRAQLTIMKSSSKNLRSLTAKIEVISAQLRETSNSIQRDAQPLKNKTRTTCLLNKS